MKNLKKIILITFTILLFSGCSLQDDFSDTYLYTTIYPVEYGTTMLYSDYAKISSVYPDESDETYEVTDKKKEIYSNGEIFVYSGLANEAEIAKDLLNLNSNLKIIDATKGMNINYNIEEVWLDPSNLLMLCSNIKRSLIEYNDNVYIKEAIEENYKKLNEKISELDVALYNIGKSGNYNTILVTNDVFNYLSKYNINVVSIDTNQESIDKAYSDAKKLISSGDIKYIYSLDSDKLTAEQEKFIKDNSLTKISIESLRTITNDERENNDNYVTLMNKIIDQFKKELYKN